MHMNNINNFKEDFAVDFELLRFEALIEEQEAYEEEFFSTEPSTDELDYLISEYEKENDTLIIDDFEVEIYNPFELEDYLDQLRDEKLIKEREIYEASYFSKVNLPEGDFLDIQIEARESEMMDGYDFDFCDFEYEEEMYWKIYYLKKSQFEKPRCTCAYMDYMPHDDLCDYLDCYDYPEGPDENLNGIKLF